MSWVCLAEVVSSTGCGLMVRDGLSASMVLVM